MDIIYSRKKDRKMRYLKKSLVCIIIFIFALDSFIHIYRVIDSVINDVCKNEAKKIASYAYNIEMNKISKEYNYDDICQIYKNDDGTIAMIKTNTNKINEISTRLALNIQDLINNMDKEKLKISIGSFTKSRILNGRGPKIGIMICSMGNVETKYISKIEAAGINQVVHKIYIETSCEIGILNPLDTITEKVISQTLFLENVITGVVPDTYYNLEGLEQVDALNVLE